MDLDGETKVGSPEVRDENAAEPFWPFPPFGLGGFSGYAMTEGMMTQSF
jgi:hypothetical protein